MLDKIKDNSILIVPSSMKSSLLKDISSSKDLLDIKIISREEFIERSTFSYDVEAILFLMDKYKYDFNVCENHAASLGILETFSFKSPVAPSITKPKEIKNVYYKKKSQTYICGVIAIRDIFHYYEYISYDHRKRKKYTRRRGGYDTRRGGCCQIICFSIHVFFKSAQHFF